MIVRMQVTPHTWIVVSDDSDDKPTSAAAHLKQYQFPKGTSGNAAGRTKGYERRLREVVEGEVVDHPIDAKLGKIPAWEAVILKAVDDAINGSPTARQHARSFLADRLIGKPKQDIRIEDVTPVDDTKLVDATDDQLEVLAMLGLADAKLH